MESVVITDRQQLLLGQTSITGFNFCTRRDRHPYNKDEFFHIMNDYSLSDKRMLEVYFSL